MSQFAHSRRSSIDEDENDVDCEILAGLDDLDEVDEEENDDSDGRDEFDVSLIHETDAELEEHDDVLQLTRDDVNLGRFAIHKVMLSCLFVHFY